MFDTFFRSVGGLRTLAYDPIVVVVELLLIGLSVNWCASVLHGTRGTRPLRGLLMLLVVATLAVNALAAQFDWPRLALLYRYFVFGLAFIALIAFQPELRRAVIRAGDVRFLRRGTRQSKVITALVQSARFLSKNRYGGLIAIQRAVDLGGWAEKGTVVSAEVTANLLNTIFFPNSPLHDLGVIVAGKRVVAANCQFPMAESDEVGTSLGSRHLAAVGMSYESDALVLVVSEETGTISLADNGKLARFLSIDDLEDELTARLSGQAAAADIKGKKRLPPARHAWRIIRRLLVVVPLTLVIWIVANQWTQTEIDGVAVQLNLRPDDPQQVADVEGAGVFGVTFRGTARAVDELRDHTSGNPWRVTWVISQRYPLRDVQQRSVRELLDSLPAIRELGLTVVKVLPEEAVLQFVVDELVTETMTVRAQTGSVRVEDERLDPERVRVTLRKRHLERLLPDDRVVRLALEEELRGAAPGELFTRQVPVPDQIKGLPLVTTEPREIDVSLRVVGQRSPPRRLSQIPVWVQGSPQFLRLYEVVPVDPQEWTIEVDVEGEERKVKDLQPQDVRAFVTVSSDLLSAPESRLDVEFALPEGVRVLSQRSVQVRCVRRESSAP